jgi:hypothetical protein
MVPNLTNAAQVIMSPLMINWTSDICEQGNGSAWVMVQGGVTPYEYEWPNGGTANTINNLVAGTYNVTITGANGCSATSSVTVPAQVYSRWGESLFEMQDFAPDGQQGWDGTFKGQKLNPAVYVWQAAVEFADGKTELFSGDVTLVR